MSPDNTSGLSACVNARHCCLMLATVAWLLACAAVALQVQRRYAWPHWMVFPPWQAAHAYLLSHRCTRNLAKLNVITVLHVQTHLVKLKGISILRALHTLLLSYRCTRNLDRLNIITMNIITVCWVHQTHAHTECCCYPWYNTPGQTECHYCFSYASDSWPNWSYCYPTHTWPNFWMLSLSSRCNTHLAKLNVIAVTQVQHMPGQTGHYCCWAGVTHTWPHWMLLLLHRCNTCLAKLNITAVEQVQHTPGQTDCYCCCTGATHTWPNWLLSLSHRCSIHLAKLLFLSYRCNTHLAKLTYCCWTGATHTWPNWMFRCHTGATHTWPNWVILSYGPTGASGIGPDCKCVHADLLSHTDLLSHADLLSHTNLLPHTATGKSFGPCFTGL